MDELFREAPAAALPPLASLEGEWKGRVVSVDTDDPVIGQPPAFPDVAFRIVRQGESHRFIPASGLGAERILEAGPGEFLARGAGLPEIHLRPRDGSLVGWIETRDRPRRRMEFHATRAP